MRAAAAHVLTLAAFANEHTVSHLTEMINRPERQWSRRDGATSVYVCVCAYVCVRAYVCVSAYVCVCACFFISIFQSQLAPRITV